MAASLRHPTILVTGATGKTGRPIVAQLLEKGWPVRALVRRRDHRSDRLESLGAQIAVADLFDFDQLRAALSGVARAYYCPPFHPFMLQSAAVFVAAAREAQLEAIVGLSQWTASPDHPALQTRQTWLVEKMLSTIPGITYVNLNPGYFADNYLRLVDFAALLGVFPLLTGSSRNAPPSNEDIARVAVALLIDPERFPGRSWRPTGPALLSGPDMAGIIRTVLKRPILTIQLPLWMFFRAARLQGVSAYELSNLRWYIQDHRQGAFELGAPNTVVEEVTGQPAESFETTVRRYLAQPFARTTLTNHLRALLQFGLVPLTPGPDFAQFERESLYPVPVAPRFVMGSDRWHAEQPAQVRDMGSLNPNLHHQP